MFLKNAFGRILGDGHFVIFPDLFYIESDGEISEEMVAMVKKQTKKTGCVRQMRKKRPYHAPKHQYYSFGIFVGEY
jgi:hypothetical protein